ncbi:MAG: hypothetical protein IT184_00790 [Acidobacteria bacterium]|nr:hypothetical protein [Acidobacteriota bacterium]
MVRRLSLVMAGVAFVAASALLSAADATFVLKNGERQSGQLVYRQGAEVYLVSGETERGYKFDDIAMIAFADASPAKSEVGQLPTGDNPPELERHMLVLKDGRAIKGKLYDFTNDSRVVFDTRTGSGGVDRQSFNMSDVARLYLSAPSARSLFGGDAVASSASGGSGTTVRVSATQRWVDTAITVTADEKVAFSASGQVKINENTAVPPAGTMSVGRRKNVPVPNGPVGALVGRVGTRMFLIGDKTDPITMPASGRLMLSINDDEMKDNSGAFDVVVKKQ